MDMQENLLYSVWDIHRFNAMNESMHLQKPYALLYAVTCCKGFVVSVILLSWMLLI